MASSLSQSVSSLVIFLRAKCDITEGKGGGGEGRGRGRGRPKLINAPELQVIIATTQHNNFVIGIN